MIEFNKENDRFSNKSISFEINHTTKELEIDSEVYTKNGLDIQRQSFSLSKNEVKEIVEYLGEWCNSV